MNKINSWINILHNNLKLKIAIEWINLIMFFLITSIALILDDVFIFNYLNYIFVGVFLFALLFYYIVYVRRFVFDVFVLLMLFFAFTMLISFAMNGFNNFPRTPILMVGLALCFYLWIRTQTEQFKKYVISMLLTTLLFLILFLIFERNGIFHPSLDNRIGTFFGNQNDVARNISYCIIINLFATFCFKNRILKSLFIINSLIFLYFLFLTGSISNLILCCLTLCVYIYWIVPKKFKLLSICGIIFFIVVVFIIVFLVPALSPIKERIISIFGTLFGINNVSNEYDASTVIRFQALTYSFQLFLNSPLFGNGYESVFLNYNVMSHNNFGEIAANFGIFAVITYELILFLPLIYLKRIKPNYRYFAFTILLYFILLQFFLLLFNSKIENIFLGVVYGLVCPQLSLNNLTNKNYDEYYVKRGVSYI